MVALGSGQNAPAFSLRDDLGKEQSLRACLQGKAAILVFFKTECPTCQLAFPFVERLYQRFKGSSVTLLAIGQNTAEEIAEFRDEYGLTMPIALDTPPYSVSDTYGITNVPTLFLVDAMGQIRRNQVGHSKDGFEKILDEACSLAALPKPEPLFTAVDASVKAMQPG